eukprot:COSAG03_NODE_1129_length_4764_cov_227.213719_4_plen_199_part_00
MPHPCWGARRRFKLASKLASFARLLEATADVDNSPFTAVDANPTDGFSSPNWFAICNFRSDSLADQDIAMCPSTWCSAALADVSNVGAAGGGAGRRGGGAGARRSPGSGPTARAGQGLALPLYSLLSVSLSARGRRVGLGWVRMEVGQRIQLLFDPALLSRAEPAPDAVTRTVHPARGWLHAPSSLPPSCLSQPLRLF